MTHLLDLWNSLPPSMREAIPWGAGLAFVCVALGLLSAVVSLAAKTSDTRLQVARNREKRLKIQRRTRARYRVQLTIVRLPPDDASLDDEPHDGHKKAS